MSGHDGVCSNAENLLRLSAMPSNVTNDEYFMLRSDIEKGYFECDNPMVRIPVYQAPKCVKSGVKNLAENSGNTAYCETDKVLGYLFFAYHNIRL